MTKTQPTPEQLQKIARERLARDLREPGCREEIARERFRQLRALAAVLVTRPSRHQGAA